MFEDDTMVRAQFDNMLRPHDIDQLQSNAQYLIKDVTIYPCLRGWLVAGLPLICT
jgi:hypothetical protein